MEVMNYLLKIDGSEDYSLGDVGGKAHNLNLLTRRGFKTPETVVLPVSAFENLLLNQISFGEINFDNIIDESARLQSEVISIELEDELQREIEDFSKQTKNSKLATRSSAPMEDSKALSFAGQFDSVLNVSPTPGEITNSIKQVWSSLYSIRALSYCIANKVDISNMRMAVVIQEMIENPDYAGTVFTYDVKGSSREQICIQAVTGLGEQVVDGSGNVSTYTLRRESLEQDFEFHSNHLLKVEDLKELTHKSLEVEKEFDDYQDIEWAINNGELYFLQTRPITTI
jgi:pyruvate,water dikinase